MAEAAEHFGVSRGWLYDHIREGALTVVESGDTRAKTRIRADHLQAFADERTPPRGFATSAPAAPDTARGVHTVAPLASPRSRSRRRAPAPVRMG